MTELHSSGLSLKNVAALQSVFKKYKQIKKVILYGSRAKGNYKTSSDIDLTIITTEKNLSFLFKVENDIDNLMLPYKVDLSIYGLLDNQNLKDHIDRIGVQFY